jgi:hypothetical protein
MVNYEVDLLYFFFFEKQVDLLYIRANKHFLISGKEKKKKTISDKKYANDVTSLFRPEHRHSNLFSLR